MSIEYHLSDDEHGARLEEEHENVWKAMVNRKKKKNTYGKKKHAFKADARLWNAETQAFTEKVARNRGETCTVIMLLKELKAFVEEGGRKRLKEERMDAVTKYEANFFENNAKKKRYPDRFSRATDFPVIKGNYYRLVEMIGQFIHDQDNRDAEATREKNAMRVEMANMRKRLWAYRKAASSNDSYKKLLEQADEQCKYYLSSEGDEESEDDEESDDDGNRKMTAEEAAQREKEQIEANANAAAADIAAVTGPLTAGDTPLAQLAGAASSSGTPAAAAPEETVAPKNTPRRSGRKKRKVPDSASSSAGGKGPLQPKKAKTGPRCTYCNKDEEDGPKLKLCPECNERHFKVQCATKQASERGYDNFPDDHKTLSDMCSTCFEEKAKKDHAFVGETIFWRDNENKINVRGEIIGVEKDGNENKFEIEFRNDEWENSVVNEKQAWKRISAFLKFKNRKNKRKKRTPKRDSNSDSD
jgi:hypothetical protein